MSLNFGTALKLMAVGFWIAQTLFALWAQIAVRDHIDTGTNQMLKSRDTAFALNVAQGGAAEVKLGKLAADKASDRDVKAFGQQMVDDHTKANDQLASVCHQENMTLPSGMTAKDEAQYNRLQNLSGAAFDKAYVADMLRDHEAAVKEFQKEARAGKDSTLKNFAAQTLPVLQGHLEKIKSIHSKMGGRSSM